MGAATMDAGKAYMSAEGKLDDLIDSLLGGDHDPKVAAHDVRMITIRDGRGGKCHFASTEVNDLVVMLASLMQSDAGAVKVVDLRNVTAE
jgi:hypothetical protein